MLRPDFVRMAGFASLGLSVLAIVALTVNLIWLGTHEGQGRDMAILALLIALGVMVGVASVSLLLGHVSMQRFLLGFWLLVSACALVFGLWAVLWGLPNWWETGARAGLIVAVVITTVLLSAAVSVLLVLASVPVSRLRYAGMATVTIFAAVTVVAAVNLIAHKDPFQKDYEALGVYGVSEWTQNILAGVDKPVRLTCIYTSKDEKKLGSDYGPRVVELLDDIASRMRKLDKDIETHNVTSDAEAAKTIGRLKGRLRKRASKHVEFLKAFNDRAVGLCLLLQAEKDPWTQLPKDAYLRLWELPSDCEFLLNEQIRRLQERGQKVHKQMESGAVVDYAELVKDLQQDLEGLQTKLKDFVPALKRRDTIAKEVKKNGKAALEAAAKVSEGFTALLAALGEKGKVKDPKAALTNFAKAAKDARKQAYDAALALQNIGGEANYEDVMDASCCLMELNIGRVPVSAVLELASRQIAQLGARAEGMVQVLTVDAMKGQLEPLRARAQGIQALAVDAQKLATQAVAALSKVDKATQALFDLATAGKLFQKPLDEIDKLVKQIKDMPEVKTEPAGDELTEDNIVIVEVGEKFKVATFDEVWPIRSRQRGWAEEEDEKRIFNGDSAIGAKILGMTQEPFATVYLTYLPPFDQQTAMQMMRMQMQMGMRGMPSLPSAFFAPVRLRALSRRLREANFEVKEWNLDETLESPETLPQDQRRPQVLIVLPPSPPHTEDMMTRMMMQRFRPRDFSDEHVAKIRAVVDAGIPAIFLTGAARWRSRFGAPVFQEINDYLRDDWRVDVKAGLPVLAGIPDRTQAGWFRIAILSFSYLPLSTFTDHPIGKPLQGQRMVWTEAAPVKRAKARRKAKLPKVTHESLLRVPEGRRDIWAPKKLAEVFRKIEEGEKGGLIRPERGDIRPPFDLALVAEREEKKAKNAGATKLIEDDVLDWKALRDKLVDGDESTTPSPQKAVWDLLAKPVRKTLKDVEDGDELTPRQRAEILAELNVLLAAPALYERKGPPPPAMPGAPPPPSEDNWEKVSLPYEAQKLYARSQKSEREPDKVAPLSDAEQRRMNRLVLESAFPEIFANTQSIEPGKIVVLAVGTSFFDSHMDQRVPKLGPSGEYTKVPAPKANADVVIAAAYWLSDNEKYIAAGPAIIKPVNVSPYQKNVLWALCVIGLPLLVGAIGGTVLILRRS